MKRTNIIEGFVYGELSPLATGQISSDAYEQSAQELVNMVPDVRGPAVSRTGMRHRARIQASTCKLFKFQKKPLESYICAFTPLKVHIIPNVAVDLGPNYITNGNFTASDISWSPVAIGTATYTFRNHRLSLCPGTTVGDTVTVRQVLNIPDGSLDYSLSLMGLFRGPAVTEAVNVKVGTAYGASDIADVNLYNDFTYQSIPLTAPGTQTLYITITARDWSGASNPDTESYITKIRLQEEVTAPANTVLASVYTAAQVGDLKAVRVPNSDKLFLLHKDVEPYELETTGPTAWTLTAISFTAMPTSWVAGNYPTTVTFHQGRSTWGGLAEEPETFVMSKSADYYDLTQGTNPDDGLTFTIDRVGLIRWILSTKNLLLGTENGEYKVSSTSGIIQPDDIQIDLQSAHGAGEVLPVLVGTETAFVSVDLRAIRAMAYYWEDDGWVAETLSQGSEHITYPFIRDLDAATNPEPVLWCVLGNGTLAACSYQYKRGGSKDKRITGWHRHQFYSPVESLTVVEEYGQSVPWVALKVEVNGSYEIHIGPIDTNSKQYLDDSLYKTYNTPTTMITGLDHLEGMEVEILADGATHERKRVVSGEIELNEPAQQVTVGKGYTARLVTQPAAIIAKSGVIRNQLGRWNEMFVYIFESALPLIDGIRAGEHEAMTRMGDSQELFTGYTNSTQLGWERDSKLTIEQDLPFPLTITHIAGELEK